jgi:hypothetical protein
VLAGGRGGEGVNLMRKAVYCSQLQTAAEIDSCHCCPHRIDLLLDKLLLRDSLAFTGEGVSLRSLACVQLSLGRMTNIEYIQNKEMRERAQSCYL